MPTAAAHVLLLSPGAKLGLTRALAEAAAARGATLSAWEGDAFSPAATLCARRASGGPVEDAAAAQQLLEWCVNEHVRLVVPTRHDDLPTLAAVRDLFAAAGVAVAVSTSECIDLCLDKAATHAWLTDLDVPVPEQTTVRELGGSALRDRWPLIAKAPRGSGSRQLRVCREAADVAALPRDWILQTLASGREYTINAYVDRTGRSVCEIPHERLMVGDGEVVRGRTARITPLMELTRRIVESLPGAAGPINVQMFWDAERRRAMVIEINPRFGGGYPLAHRAGGRFTDWLLAEYLDGAALSRIDDWESDLLMVRYREAMFFRDGIAQ